MQRNTSSKLHSICVKPLQEMLGDSVFPDQRKCFMVVDDSFPYVSLKYSISALDDFLYVSLEIYTVVSHLMRSMHF